MLRSSISPPERSVVDSINQGSASPAPAQESAALSLGTRRSTESDHRRSQPCEPALQPKLPFARLTRWRVVLLEALLGVVDGASLPDHHHLDLAGVLQHLLDLLDDVTGHAVSPEIVHRVRLHDDSYLTACLNGIALLDALEGIGNVLECFEALDVHFQRVATRARAGGRNRVGGLDQER